MHLNWHIINLLFMYNNLFMCLSIY